jgi:hypothetical protein
MQLRRVAVEVAPHAGYVASFRVNADKIRQNHAPARAAQSLMYNFWVRSDLLRLAQYKNTT